MSARTARSRLFALMAIKTSKRILALNAYRAEVLREAGAVADELIATVQRTDPDAFARVDSFRAYSDRLHEIADGDTPARKDTGDACQAPTGESTQPGGPFERVTVILTSASSTALTRAAEITGDNRTDTINRAVQSYSLLAGEVADGGRVLVQPPPAPDFFQPERTYTRPSHGRTVTFQVTHISTAPDGTTVTAFGWHQIEGYDTWQAYSSEDFDNGWTEGGDAR